MNNLLLVSLALGLSACFPQLPKVPEIEIPEIEVPKIEVPEASELATEILSPTEKTLQPYR